MPLLDNYLIKKTIYTSGNSTIFLSTENESNHPIVIKLMNKEFPTNDEVARFHLEYKISNIINVSDTIKIHKIKKFDNRYGLIMDYFNGLSLSDYITSNKIDLIEFFDISIKLVDIIGRLHEKKIIHKDINPSNILWNNEKNDLRIIDFGISAFISSETQNSADIEGLEGSIHYISPEQTGRMNRKIDYRSDYYSLGCSFYELLTGHKPFESTDIMEIIHYHIAKDPISPSEIDKTIPKILSDIILKLMAKNAEDRYQGSLGIKHDLLTCREIILNNKDFKDFNIGENDIPERFEIPQKLYGRKKEINLLIESFNNIIEEDSSKVIFISGYSGIGKSSLVNEIHKPVLTNKGHFISGKFEQYSENIPYIPFIQSIQNLIKQILTENQESIEAWKNRILKAVGSVGKVITDVVSELEYIIGKQPDVPELLPQQSQNRFNNVMLNFFKELASPEHPLVIFIDDLQWSDNASLNLFRQLIAEQEIKNILFIGSFRENEVSHIHPLYSLIKEFNIALITVNPIDLSSVNSMVIDTFKCSDEKAILLSMLCLEKTGGNPFFINQFLKSLYQEKLVYYDFENGQWDWKIELIKNKSYSENIIDLLINKLYKLSEETQDILKLAACCGNKFDLFTLSGVNGKSLSTTANQLCEAMNEEIILPITNNYKLVNDESDGASILYRFAHDRLEQASYYLIEEEKRKKIHLKIARLMLNSLSNEKKDAKIFDITNNYNISKDLIHDENEKMELIKLNVFSGKKAKNSSAYDIAYKYYKTSIDILGEESFSKNYELALECYVEASELSYLCGNYDEMEKYINIVIKNSKELLDKVKVYEVKIRSQIAQNERLEGIKTGIFVLKLLGINISENITKLDVIINILKMKMVLFNKSEKDILSMPIMTDKRALTCIRILSSLLSSSYMINPALLFILSYQMIKLSMKYGNHHTSIFGYGAFALGMSVLESTSLGIKWRDICASLFNMFNQPVTIKAFYTYTYNHFLKFHDTDIKPLLKASHTAYNDALEGGDLEFAAFSMADYLDYCFFSGQNLQNLLETVKTILCKIKKTNQESIFHLSSIQHRGILYLTIYPFDLELIEKSTFNEEELKKIFISQNYISALAAISFFELQKYFFFGDTIKAQKSSLLFRKYITGLASTVYMPLFYLYESLIYFDFTKLCSFNEKIKAYKIIHKNFHKINKISNLAPMNHLQKLQLIKAEIYRALGKKLLAMEYYDKAIETASKNQYIHEEAIASERAGLFYLSIERNRTAMTYLAHSRHCYNLWGAIGKVKYMNQTYPELVNNIQSLDKKTIVASKTILYTECQSKNSFELMSIIKASQAISGEIVYKNLIEKLMKVVVENAGAQKIILIANNDGRFFPEAEYNINNDNLKINTMIEYKTDEIQFQIPLTVINFIFRTKKILILDDFQISSEFQHDVYIKRFCPKSIVCFPLIYQGNLSKILYLENNLSTGIFKESNLETLKLLTTQMVISLENSKIYTHLEELVDERTKSLKQEITERQKAQKLLEEMATHDNLTGLANRRLFMDRLEHTINIYTRNKNIFCVLFIDLDGFKKINDTYGHESGDIVLKSVSNRLKNCIRSCDTIARLGGDEFVIILENINSPENSIIVSDKIIKEIGKPIKLAKNIMAFVTPSIGISLFPNDGKTATELLSNADTAMYKAKNSGKNTVVFFDTIK